MPGTIGFLGKRSRLSICAWVSTFEGAVVDCVNQLGYRDG
jgi:hypothetical protein